MTERNKQYLGNKQVNLLYVSSGNDVRVKRLHTATPVIADFPQAMLDRLQALKRDNNAALEELWLTNQSDSHSQLYMFIRLDERDVDSGWLGLDMDGREVSHALDDRSAGQFMMFNSDGMLVFSNSQRATQSKPYADPESQLLRL